MTTMTEVAPEKRGAYHKVYYEANREKVAVQQKTYREANREKVAAQQVAAHRKAYQASHPAALDLLPGEHDADEWGNATAKYAEDPYDPYRHLDRDAEDREAIEDLLGRRES